MAEFVLRHKLLVVLAWLALSAISYCYDRKTGPAPGLQIYDPRAAGL